MEVILLLVLLCSPAGAEIVGPIDNGARSAAVSDAAYVNVAGDTMTGPLTLASSSLTVTGNIEGRSDMLVSDDLTIGNNSGENGVLTVKDSAVTETVIRASIGSIFGGPISVPHSLTASTLTVTGNAFSVGGSILVVSGGKVGVGISPSEPLAVRGATTETDIARFYSQNSTATIVLSPSGGANAARITSTFDTNSTIDLFTGGINRLRVSGGGNVGIGDTAPTAKLVVNGNFVSSGTVTASGLPTSAGANGLYVCIDENGVMYKKSSCP